MLSRLVRGQLIAFVVVTVLTLAYVAGEYVKLPQLLGFGEYQVSMELGKASGLYPNARITYRGYDVGQVNRVDIRPGGATVVLDIEKGQDIPADSVAEVHSRSAIGEQYVDFVPRSAVAAATLQPGDVIPASRTNVPVSTPQLLETVNTFVRSVPQEALRTTFDELYKAFNGTDRNLQQVLDSGGKLVDAAANNADPTMKLIDTLVPVLGTQQQSAADIASFTHDLSSFTSQLNQSDNDFRNLLAKGPPFLDQVTGIVNDLNTSLPTLMADLASVGPVLRTYLPALEHVLIVYPAALQGVQAAAAGSPDMYQGPGQDPNGIPHARVNFKLGVNTPPTCVQGFEFADRQRNVHDQSPAPVPADSFCDLPDKDPTIVRGARHLPCPNNPNLRSRNAIGCGLNFPRFTPPGATETKTESVLPRRTDSPHSMEYDPNSGKVNPDGQFFLLSNASQEKWKPKTWRDLMEFPMTK